MPEYRKGPHTTYDIQYDFVWVTKYRYKVLRAEIAGYLMLGLHANHISYILCGKV